LIRVNVQHDPRDLAPVGTIRIQHPHVSDGVLTVVRREARSVGAMSATSGSRGGLCMGLSRSYKRI
jgi:hypothetical protein